MGGRIFLHKLVPLIPGVRLHLNASIYLRIIADQIFFLFHMAASSKIMPQLPFSESQNVYRNMTVTLVCSTEMHSPYDLIR